MSNRQFQFDFEPGLTQRWKSLKALTIARVQNVGTKQSVLAAACDTSPSEFSKSLAGIDNRRFDLDWLEKYIDETKDLAPVYYLVEKYMESPEAKQARVLSEFSDLLKQGQQLLKQANLK